jgi:hypothetical protein
MIFTTSPTSLAASSTMVRSSPETRLCGIGLGIDGIPKLPDLLGEYGALPSISVNAFHQDRKWSIAACLDAALALVASVRDAHDKQHRHQQYRRPKHINLPTRVETLVNGPEGGWDEPLPLASEPTRLLAAKLLYFAPELVADGAGQWTEASDVYALGSLLLQLFGGNACCCLQDPSASAALLFESFRRVARGEKTETILCDEAKTVLDGLPTKQSLALVGSELQTLIKSCWAGVTIRPNLDQVFTTLSKCKFEQARQGERLLHSLADVVEKTSLLDVQFEHQTCHVLLSELAEKWQSDSFHAIDHLTRILAASLMIFPEMPDGALWTRWIDMHNKYQNHGDETDTIKKNLEDFLLDSVARRDFASDKVEIKVSSHEAGLFAKSTIACGDVLAMYSGALYAEDDHLRICQSPSLLAHKRAYWLSISVFTQSDYVIDPYLNHGSAAMAINDFTAFGADGKAAAELPQDKSAINCAFDEISHRGWKYVVVTATADVAVGNELLVEYGNDYWFQAGKARENTDTATHVAATAKSMLF